MLRTILVVDDNELNREVLSRRLELEQYKVITAENGQQAMDILSIEAPDAMLLDINMPVMDGYAVLEKMKESAKLKVIPVMMVTALNDMPAVVKCIQGGARDYITKPFDPALLRGRVERLLAQRRSVADPAEDPSALIEGNVLVVDDNELNRDVLARRLVEYGLTVTKVGSGKEALEAVKTTKFDLIMLDIMMPGMDGYKVLEALKSDRATKKIAVLMISSVEDYESIKRALQLGAADYVVKPFDNYLLRARVRCFFGAPGQSVSEETDLNAWRKRIAFEVKGGAVTLPVPTDIATTILQLSEDPTANIEEIARLIALDPSMTARILAVANSTLFKGVTKVGKVMDAIARIGLKETRHYVATIAHKEAFNCNMKLTGQIMDRLWLHSLGSALAAKYIAEKKGFPADEMYTYGLLHDVGMALAIKVIEQSNAGAALQQADIESLVQLVHEELGSHVLKAWSLDSKFVDAVTTHHGKWDSGNTIQNVIMCADDAAVRAGLNGVESVDKPRAEVWNALDFDESQIEGCVAWVKQEIDKVKAI